jgi:hypothetical protein
MSIFVIFVFNNNFSFSQRLFVHYKYLYIALAKVTLAFWPPERAIPLSPTRVRSPNGH